MDEQSDGPKRWIGRFLIESLLATARSSGALFALSNRLTSIESDASVFVIAAQRLQQKGLWAVAKANRIRSGHYFERPHGIPEYTATFRAEDFSHPVWYLPYRDREVRVDGYPIEMICTDDSETNGTASTNFATATRWCRDGLVYLGDCSHICLYEGSWIPNDAPRWIFENEVIEWFGGSNPDSVARLTNQIDEAVAWMFRYNDPDHPWNGK